MIVVSIFETMNFLKDFLAVDKNRQFFLNFLLTRDKIEKKKKFKELELLSLVYFILFLTVESIRHFLSM